MKRGKSTMKNEKKIEEENKAYNYFIAFRIITIILSIFALYLLTTCIVDGELVMQKNLYWSLGLQFSSIFFFVTGRSFIYRLKTYEKLMQYGSIIFVVVFVIMGRM